MFSRPGYCHIFSPLNSSASLFDNKSWVLVEMKQDSAVKNGGNKPLGYGKPALRGVSHLVASFVAIIAGEIHESWEIYVSLHMYYIPCKSFKISCAQLLGILLSVTSKFTDKWLSRSITRSSIDEVADKFWDLWHPCRCKGDCHALRICKILTSTILHNNIWF